jgi:cellulose synthase (UDP-forming)
MDYVRSSALEVAACARPEDGGVRSGTAAADLAGTGAAAHHALADWAQRLGAPAAESARARRLARVGAVVSLAVTLAYLVWRVGWTLPSHGAGLVLGTCLVGFEALPLFGLLVRTVTWWNIDCPAPASVRQAPSDGRVAVLIPTYNEPVEVIAPTIAAACALAPEHETWVLDDGDRDWVKQLCDSLGARYLRRPTHEHAKAGNMNHALAVMAAEEAAGGLQIEFIAVLDCDHVPLPNFLTATLGWFADPTIALVQGAQAFYNAGAFDDDGAAGEQGLFFNVQLPARNGRDAGPFWCGSTALLRLAALRAVGGIATDTITEDMHTTLRLLEAGWRTAYHHQVLAVGLAPETAQQYLLQRRRWGLGCMQILVHERLWAAKRRLSWRNHYEYLSNTLWWLEGVGTVVAFLVPSVVLLSDVRISTASPLAFAAAFSALLLIRLTGAHYLMRGQIHLPTALALRMFRIPIGIACLWWLLTRRDLRFEVTPKGGDDVRSRGRTPRVLPALTATLLGIAGYTIAGATGLTPWHAPLTSTLTSGAWLAIAVVVLIGAQRRVRSDRFATSRRNAYRVPLDVPVTLDGIPGQLVDLSMGGAAVRFPPGTIPNVGRVQLTLPGAEPVAIDLSRPPTPNAGYLDAALQIPAHHWHSYTTIARWLFHTPSGAVPGLPDHVPAVAVRQTRALPVTTRAIRPAPRTDHNRVSERLRK